MDRRLAHLAGLAAFSLMLGRLGRLFQVGSDTPEWRIILVAAAVLGALVWWLLGQVANSRRLASALWVVGGLLLFLRVAIPEALFAGIVPTAGTPAALEAVFGEAIPLIRYGIPPIAPTAGVVAILALLFWVVGGLYTWGVLAGKAAAMVLPSLAFYLQFAVFDRVTAGLSWMAASTATLAIGVTAVAVERHRDTGRARDSRGRPIPRRSPGMAIALSLVVGVGAVLTASSASGLISEYGNVPWRALGAGYGPATGGGVAFNRLVDLRQRIISRTNAVLFRATLGEGSPPPSEIYWRMETLEQFDGVAWRPSLEVRSYDPPIGDPAHAYRGTTVEVLQLIQIQELRGSQLAPTAVVPMEVHSPENGIPASSFQVKLDSSLVYPSFLRSGDTYQVSATVPIQEADLGALATGSDGTLSPLFAAAAAEGLFSGAPSLPDRPFPRPADLDRFTELPDDLPTALGGIARIQTRGATTDFERAWLLQWWFRDSGEFTYSTEVTTGHEALVLLDWLTDPESPNYRTGYCEQFAASMAVLGRALGIPSRVVWGFTPGSVETQADATELIVVRDTNAHAWVEMWIDGFGWVQFDPTPRGGNFLPESMTAGFEPGEFIPEQAASEPLQQPDPRLLERDQGDVGAGPGAELVGQLSRWTRLLLPALALIFLAVPLIKSVRRRLRLARVRRGDITAAWDELIDRLTDLGEGVSPSKTPLELARATALVLVPLADKYSAAIYGGRVGEAQELDLLELEIWVRGRWDPVKRTRAAMSPRSLTRRSPKSRRLETPR